MAARWAVERKLNMLDQLFSLYAPSDIEKAHRLYGATCGPCSLAALVRRDACDLRDVFPTFPETQFTNMPMMTRAIQSLGLSCSRTADWPQKGVALLCGPTDYHSRHWIAVQDNFVYEVSLDTWLPRIVWERDFLPELARHHNSTVSQWRLEAGFEILGLDQTEFAWASSRNF